MCVHHKFRPLAFCALSAALLALAFPPIHWHWLAWFGLVPFLTALQGATYPGAFRRGYVFGFLYYLGTVWWIGHVTVPGMLLLVSYLALYYAFFGLWCRFTHGFSFGTRAWAVPAGYVVLESIRDRAFTGFGWAGLGHTQASMTAQLYVCEWTGLAGISFLLVLGNVIVKEWQPVLSRRKGPEAVLIAATAFLGLVLAGGTWSYPALSARDRSSGRPLTKVALVQPNVPLEETWDPSSKTRVVRKLLAMSREALKDKPDLIIWPETSFPHFYWQLKDLFAEVEEFARQNRVSLLVGAVTRAGDDFYNSALLITPDGYRGMSYSKRHLVVFGEYIPLREQLPFLASIVPIDDFREGETDVIFTLPNGARFSVLICFEDTISGLARRDAANGADFLVNMTNDAWFGDSGQQRMHLENALFRSVENRRPLLRATNTGETCAVSSGGKAGPCVEDDRGRRVLVDGITVLRVGGVGVRSFYTKYGDVFTLACGMGILIIVIWRVSNSRRGKADG